jgi:hypothetical protein
LGFPGGNDRRNHLGHILTSAMHEQAAIANLRPIGPSQAKMQFHGPICLNFVDLHLSYILTFDRTRRSRKQRKQPFDDILGRGAVGGTANIDWTCREDHRNHYRRGYG